jgi:hypothetical protein
MAVTYANREIISRGTYTLYYVEITMDSAYAADGEAIAAADFGFKVIKGIWPSHAEGHIVEPVRSSDTAWLMKVYAFSNSTNTVLGNIVTGKDLSAVTIPCLILGR